MNEEEKEAIKELKTNAEYCIDEDSYLKYDKYETKKIIMPVLNYIDRLQKELEQEKEKNKELELTILDNTLLTEYGIILNSRPDLYIHKDKIKNKIKEYDNMIQATYNDPTHQGDIRRDTCREIKAVLEELLEE